MQQRNGTYYVLLCYIHNLQFLLFFLADTIFKISKRFSSPYPQPPMTTTKGVTTEPTIFFGMSVDIPNASMLVEFKTGLERIQSISLEVLFQFLQVRLKSPTCFFFNRLTLFTFFREMSQSSLILNNKSNVGVTVSME